MRSDNEIVGILKARQCAMRRELDRRGIALKAVSFDSGLPYSSLQSYFPDERAAREPALMPVSALYALCGAVPDDVLSLVLPDGRLIVQAPVEVDHDQVSDAMRDFLRAKDKAHHPDSEAGRELGPNEDVALRAKLSVVKAAA